MNGCSSRCKFILFRKSKLLKTITFSLYFHFFLASRVREASHFYAKARRWPRFDIQMIPELILNDREQLRVSLRWLLKSHIKDIILFCDERDLAAIMNEVQHLNHYSCNQEEPNEIEENICL